MTSLHVLGHLLDVPRALGDEYAGRRPAGRRAPVASLAVALALAAGVALGLLLVPHYGAWITWHRLRFVLR